MDSLGNWSFRCTVMTNLFKEGEDSISPENCIVLTSKTQKFVDLRWNNTTIKNAISGADQRTLTWAFAGVSSIQGNHGQWSHWIDSNSDHPEKDEGTMTDVDGGSLEEGGYSFKNKSNHVKDL
jgi:hypothetical protein